MSRKKEHMTEKKSEKNEHQRKITVNTGWFEDFRWVLEMRLDRPQGDQSLLRQQSASCHCWLFWKVCHKHHMKRETLWVFRDPRQEHCWEASIRTPEPSSDFRFPIPRAPSIPWDWSDWSNRCQSPQKSPLAKGQNASKPGVPSVEYGGIGEKNLKEQNISVFDISWWVIYILRRKKCLMNVSENPTWQTPKKHPLSERIKM